MVFARRFPFGNVRSMFGIVALLGVFGCRAAPDVSDPASDAYREAVSSFYSGLASLQSGEDRRAEEQLGRLSRLAPEEPAVWANLGVLALRRNELDLAEERFERGRRLVPENSHLHFLLGLVAATRGDVDTAILRFERAREFDPSNVKATFALVEQIEQRGGDDALHEMRRLLRSILDVEPENLVALVESARLAAIAGDAEELNDVIERLRPHSVGWSTESVEQLQAVSEAAGAGDLSETAMQVAFLNNVLRREADFRETLNAVRPQPGQAGDLVTAFMWLPHPRSEPAPPDDGMSFTAESIFPDLDERLWQWARSVTLSEDALPVVTALSGDRLFFEDGSSMRFPAAEEVGPRGMIPLDYDYDFRVDLAFAGPRGFALYRQEADSSFTDVTARLGLPAYVAGGSYTAGWSVDVDMDGDVDLILAAEDGPPVVLRNNGDGTFTEIPVFQDVSLAVDFVWADLDADGDPDAVFLDASGTVHFFENRRSRGFVHHQVDGLDPAVALAVADLDADGILELVVLKDDGRIVRRQHQVGAVEELQEEIAAWPDFPGPPALLFAVDLDNNGSLDVVASAGGETAAWLQHDDGSFVRLETPTPALTHAVADVTGGGRLDLIGLCENEQPVRMANIGTKGYNSKAVLPRAAQATGDQRVNPFGIGAEVEVRAGMLYQKQVVTDPVMHFGLGEHRVVDVVRIIWPNGDVQAEFDLLPDEIVQARQRLKGSCPWLFTFDGEQMQFVTDFIWRSPLGLAINAQETAGVLMTEDWVKIDGDLLRPRDGVYDVRITAELWETHFFDHVSLKVVDHPAETEVFVDERFVVPPPDHMIYVTGPKRPVRSVIDHRGRDVTDYVRRKDERYLQAFEIGQYQGLAQEHAIEIDLGDAPAHGPLYLIADGWLRPTDSSINVAISQGSHEPPRGLRMDVPDGRGGWKTVDDDLGFPAGKHKTIVVDLTDVFVAEQRIRLSTNMEIYWDAFSWAEGRPDVDVATQRLLPSVADLRYRGYSAVVEPDRTHPEVPVYDSLASTVQVWQDLEGYYTRFGDVRELLEEVDDRYVIMNAGDELALEFPAPPDPPEGWMRTFVLIGDGWVKDGDYNTSFSETVLPLPSHGNPDYTRPPTTLEDDPVYQRHREDWVHFHTRYVSPLDFRQSLVGDR